jgi:hypothetical protein
MSTIPLRQRDILARLIALGRPVTDAARAAELTPEDVATLLDDASFRDLVASWNSILDASPEARRQRLSVLADIVIREAADRGDPEAIRYMEEEEDQRDGEGGATMH